MPDFYLDVTICILTLVKRYGLYKGNILAALKSTYTLCNCGMFDVREGEGLTSICESYCHHNKHKEGQARKDISQLPTKPALNTKSLWISLHSSLLGYLTNQTANWTHFSSEINMFPFAPYLDWSN